MKSFLAFFARILLACLVLTCAGCAAPVAGVKAAPAGFSFALAGGMGNFTGPGQYDTSQYFRGALKALAQVGNLAFLISPGDFSPPEQARWTIDQVLGSGLRWVPVVGNDELPGDGTESTPGTSLAWLNAYDSGAVNPGPDACPKTTYSFDYQNAHFVVLDEYCGARSAPANVSDALNTWLVADLAAHHAAHTFVIGHEPAFPEPDQDTGKLGSEQGNLSQAKANRDRFWALLRQAHVTAYLCGHSHTYSAVRINGVWQIDVGHASGLGDPQASSTVVVIGVHGSTVSLQTYREKSPGGAYALSHHGILAGWNTLLPFSHVRRMQGP